MKTFKQFLEEARAIVHVSAPNSSGYHTVLKTHKPSDMRKGDSFHKSLKKDFEESNSVKISVKKKKWKLKRSNDPVARWKDT